MNKDDRIKMEFFAKSLSKMDEKTTQLDRKVDRILRVLEDDQYSNNTGLITEVNDLKDAVDKLMYINRNVKKIFIWLLTVSTGILVFLLKRLFN